MTVAECSQKMLKVDGVDKHSTRKYHGMKLVLPKRSCSVQDSSGIRIGSAAIIVIIIHVYTCTCTFTSCKRWAK